MSSTLHTDSPRRIVAYDALRAFAILSVVAIHTLMPYRDMLPKTAPVRLFDDVLHYAVPLFVFISGSFLWSRPLPAGGFGRFLAKRASVIFVPFAVWSVFYLALRFTYQAPTGTLGRTMGLLLTGHIWYHLYFIPMLLTFYLLTPAAVRIAERSPELLLVACYALRIALGPTIIASARDVGGDLLWSYAVHVLTHLPHMALGAWFALRRPRVARWWIAVPLLVIGVSGAVAISLGLTASLPEVARRLAQPAFMAATVLGLTGIALLLEPTFERFEGPVLRAAALSFGVYFVHPALLLGIDVVLAKSGTESLWLHAWFPVTVFAVVAAGSFGISALLGRTPLACRLIGAVRPSQQRPAVTAAPAEGPEDGAA